METTQTQNHTVAKYLTLRAIAEYLHLSYDTLRLKIGIAKRLNLPLPPRKRISKSYLYPLDDFTQWLWRNADALKQDATHLQALNENEETE